MRLPSIPRGTRREIQTPPAQTKPAGQNTPAQENGISRRSFIKASGALWLATMVRGPVQKRPPLEAPALSQCGPGDLPVPIACNENYPVSAEFKSNVEHAFRELFITLRTFDPDLVTPVLSNDYQVVLTRRITQAIPEMRHKRARGFSNENWDEASGLHLSKRRIIVMPEYHLVINGLHTKEKPVSTENIMRLARHEYGHALDASLLSSNLDPAFMEAYIHDVAEMDPQTREQMDYYLIGTDPKLVKGLFSRNDLSRYLKEKAREAQASGGSIELEAIGPRGMRETWAEAFAKLTRPNPPEEASAFEKAFPRCVAFLSENVLKSPVNSHPADNSVV